MTALKLHSAAGHWMVAGSVLGSGAVFLKSSVVNVALPAIARDVHVGVVGLQWVINNAVARLAGLISTAALPLAAGIGGSARLEGAAFSEGYVRAMLISAGLCAGGAAVALITLRSEHPTPERTRKRAWSAK